MRHSTARGTRLAALVAVVTLIVAACGGSSSSDGPTKVSVGVIPLVDVAPLYLGIAKGFFAKHGLQVTPRPAVSGTAIIPAVLADEDQIGFSGVVSLLAARENGVPLRAVAAASSSTGDPARDINAVLVGKDSTLQRARDLEGRTVAINALNNIGDTTIRTAVQRDGGDPSKVNFVEMPFSDMPALLAAGKIDAAWESEPLMSVIKAQGGRALFDNLTATYPHLQIALYFTTEQMLQKDPQMVQSFVAAMNESLEYATAHPAEARQIATTYTKITSAQAARVNLPAWPTTMDEKSATVVGDAARGYGTLTKAPDVAGLFAQGR